MGVLDDAIREHLALKRRHGADPTEVAREEQNALGPVRREPEAAVAGGATPEPQVFDVDHAPLDPEYPEHASYDPDDSALVPAELDAHHAPLDLEDSDQAPATLDAEHAPHDLVGPDLVSAEPRPAGSAPPASQDDDAKLPSTELYADEQAALEEQALPLQGLEPEPTEPDPATGREEDASSEPDQTEPALEDVLEETPEFLQETPEHDRLWFEQRPPRDFDFDK